MKIRKYYESILFFKCPKCIYCILSISISALSVLLLLQYWSSKQRPGIFQSRIKCCREVIREKKKKYLYHYFLRLAGSLNRLIDRDIFLTKATTCSVPKVRLLDKGECLFHFMHNYRFFFIKRIVLSPRQVFYLLMW